MHDRFWRWAPSVFGLSLAATFILYVAHPGEPQAASLQKYLAVSGPWHIALYAVCFVQLVTAALIAGASLERPGAASGLLLASIGLNADFAHAAGEGFIFPSFARTVPPPELMHAVQNLYSSTPVLALTLFTLAATAIGLAVLAFTQRLPRAVRAFAAAAVLLVPLSFIVPNSFDLFAFCAYAALALAARALSPSASAFRTIAVEATA